MKGVELSVAIDRFAGEAGIRDGQGAWGVLSANPAAIEMGWHSGDGGPPAACHEMFACRAKGS